METITRHKPPGLLHRRYLPVTPVRETDKGGIFKGINLKRFAFTWCLIKEGIPSALADPFGRDIKDRLLWQKEVLDDLGKEFPTPRLIDFFEHNQRCYLVLDHMEAVPLGLSIVQLQRGHPWRELDTAAQKQLLEWYLQSIETVELFHRKGYVHRDITEANFLLLKDGRIALIDFELSWSVKRQKPNPPFQSGTEGYMSPGQLRRERPGFKDDVYSFGALLCFIIAAKQPKDFIGRTEVTRSRLMKASGSAQLTALTMRCLDPSGEARPSLKRHKENITTFYNDLKKIQ